MEVKLKFAAAGPDGAHPAGSIVDLPADQARQLLAERQVIEVTREVEDAEQIENAEAGGESSKESRKRARDEARKQAEGGEAR